MKHAKRNLKRRPPQAPAARAVTTLSARLLLALALTGCANLPTDLVATGTLNVERLSSSNARIGSVFVGDEDGLLLVRGRLEKRYFGRGRIPGHLHIEALGQDGAMLGQVTAGYRRLSPKTGLSEFSRVLDINPEQVRTVRLIHHYRDDDEGAGNASPVPAANSGTHGQLQSV